jgi:hypothetical protein
MPPVAPCDVTFRIDVALRARQAEAHLDACRRRQRTRRPYCHAPVAEVQREGRRDGVAEPVLDRDAERDAWTAAPIEVVGEEVWSERRENVLHGAVLVDISGHAQSGQLANFLRTGDRAAEDENRQPSLVEFAQRPHQADARRVGQPQVEHDQVDVRLIRAYAGEEIAHRLDRHRMVARALERRPEAVAHERRVVGDDDGLRSNGRGGHRIARLTRAHAQPAHIAVPRALSL